MPRQPQLVVETTRLEALAPVPPASGSQACTCGQPSQRAWHWELARNLCETYDAVYLEDLNPRGMQRLWGRKISNPGHGNFVRILRHVAKQTGTHLSFVDRTFPSSKQCSVCGSVNPDPGLLQREGGPVRHAVPNPTGTAMPLCIVMQKGPLLLGELASDRPARLPIDAPRIPGP
ncbi:hypothetical protein NKDENANG_04025 [Candidatus Entotheonellaceae bacterium PAL068K]